MDKPVVKKYNKENLTVVWQPELCIHSEKCWRGLVSVFNPKNRPWVDLDGASAEDIKAQIEKCPSGALSYVSKEVQENTDQVQIEIMPNGPYVVKGAIKLSQEGAPTGKPKSNTVALCRCGASGTKPFCDGSHAKVGFEG